MIDNLLRFFCRSPEPERKHRLLERAPMPKRGLALSSGGASGLAHGGVIDPVPVGSLHEFFGVDCVIAVSVIPTLEDLLQRRFLKGRVVPFCEYYGRLFGSLRLTREEIRGTDDLVKFPFTSHAP